MAKILLITGTLPYPPNKGERVRALGILEALKSFAELDLICISREKAETEQIIALGKLVNELKIFELNKFSSLFNIMLSFFTGKSFTESYFTCAKARYFLGKLDFSKYAGVMLVSGNILGNLSRQQIHLLKANLLWDLTDFDSLKWKIFAKEAKNIFFRFIYNREAKLVSKLEELIIQNSKATYVINQRELARVKESLHHLKAKLLPQSLPENYAAKIAIKKDEQLLVFSGQMDYLPNIKAVQHLNDEIIPLVKLKYPQIRTLIVGRNPSEELKKNCHLLAFSGEVSNSAELISQASVYVAPLSNIFGTPSKILEAFACYVPVVGPQEFAEVYSVTDGLQMLLAKSPNEYAEKIIKLIEDKELAAQIAQRANTHLQEFFSVKNVAKILQADLAKL